MFIYRRKVKQRTVELFKIIEETLDDVNDGGCLFAAYGVWCKLKAEGFDMKGIGIVQFSSNTWDIEHNKKFIKGKNDMAESSNHFGLYIGNSFFDSQNYDGSIFQMRWYNTFKIPYKDTERFCISALRRDIWNPEFCKRTELPKLKKITKVNFNLILK